MEPSVVLQELIRTFHTQETRKQRPANIGKLREGGLDDSQQERLLDEIIQRERNRQGITKPTDG